MKIPGVKEIEHIPLKTMLQKEQEREFRNHQSRVIILIALFICLGLVLFLWK